MAGLIRYIGYLVVFLVFQVITLVITPFLPLFRENRFGPLDNNSSVGFGPRLIEEFWMFDTPDNSLLGDGNWSRSHDGGYWSMVAWLYRNSLYGFKWRTIACNVLNPDLITIKGNPQVNRNNGITGTMSAKYESYWQLKIVKKIFGNFGIMFNFGWQLNEFHTSGKPGVALFQFSPRFVSIK